MEAAGVWAGEGGGRGGGEGGRGRGVQVGRNPSPQGLPGLGQRDLRARRSPALVQICTLFFMGK